MFAYTLTHSLNPPGDHLPLHVNHHLHLNYVLITILTSPSTTSSLTTIPLWSVYTRISFWVIFYLIASFFWVPPSDLFYRFREVAMKTDGKAGFYGLHRIQLAARFHGYCPAISHLECSWCRRTAPESRRWASEGSKWNSRKTGPTSFHSSKFDAMKWSTSTKMIKSNHKSTFIQGVPILLIVWQAKTAT